MRTEDERSVPTGRYCVVPPDLWQACPDCNQLLYTRDLEAANWVCEKCGHHFRLTVWRRLQITVDANSFDEWDHDLPLHDPLEFPEYLEKTRKAQQKTGMTEAVLTGKGKLEGMPLAIGLMDLSFVGGSMGWVVGEKVTRMMERAIDLKLPVVMFCASGGARMQESLISLMQMPKTSGAAGRLAKAGLPYITVLTHPTYGGVTASFAFLGDVIIAEAGAAMGFAGPRVVELTGLKMPPHVQTAEFQYEHGMIDLLLERKDIRPTLHSILRWCMS